MPNTGGRVGGGFWWGRRGFGQGWVQQAVGVVVGRAEQLAAGHVLEDGRDPPAHLHGAGIHGLAMGEAGQGGAVGAEQEGGFDQVALGLQDGPGCELAVVAGALAHYAVDRTAELRLDLIGRDGGQGRVATALGGEPGVGGVDCPFTAFYGNVGHGSGLLDGECAGEGGEAVAGAENEVDATGEAGVVGGPLGGEAGRQAFGLHAGGRGQAGAG